MIIKDKLKSLNRSISPELTLAALLSRPRMTEQHIADSYLLSKTIDVQQFKTLVDHHRIWPCVYRNIQDYNLTLFPASLNDHFKKRYKKNKRDCLQQFKILNELLFLFGSKNIPVRVLKGIPLAKELYSDISKRQSKDIDIIIPKNKLNFAHELLLANNYKCLHLENFSIYQEELYLKTHKDITYISPTGELLELHVRVCEYSTTFSNKMTEQLFSISSTSEKLNNELLYLCWHGAHTLFHRLKWLCDISLYIEKNHVHFNKSLDELMSLADQLDVARELTVSWVLVNKLYNIKLPSNIEKFYNKDLISRIQTDQSLCGIGNIKKQKSINFKIRMCLCEILMPRKWFNKLHVIFHRLKPTVVDLKALPKIPRHFIFLYYILRPFSALYFYKLRQRKPLVDRSR